MSYAEDHASFVTAARHIADSTETEAARMIVGLRKSKRLFETVHKLNRLLADPSHHDVAMQALRRLGLDRAG